MSAEVGPGAANAGDTAISVRNPGRAPRWAWMAATVFGAGFLRPAPGTWGAAAALGLWVLTGRFIPQVWQMPAALAAAFAALAVGIPAASQVARQAGMNDPAYVVIDEMAGQFLALAGSPFRWKPMLAAFVLFRVFDILKPPPVRQLERIPGGAGIMLDDVGAGAYALLCLQLLLRYRALS